FGPASVELAVEDPLPRPEVQGTVRDRHHHLAPHDLALVVRVGVVLAGAVVPVALRARIVRRQLLEPALVVLVKAGLVVGDEHARGDVQRVHETTYLPNTALAHRSFDLRRNVHEVHAGGDSEGERPAQLLHARSITILTTRHGRAIVLSCRN